MPDQPSKPRGTTPIPRGRDERVTTSPPPGSELAIAQASLERMRSVVPRGQWDDADSKTPIGASDYETLAFRAKRAAANSKKALEAIAEVRSEFQAADATLGVRLDKVDGRLHEMHGEISAQSGQLKILVGFAERAQTAALQTQTMTVTTKLEVDKAQAFAAIAETRELGKFRRFVGANFVRVVVAFGLALAAGITALVQKC